MTLSITSEIEQRITIQLNSGRYKSADEVILAALELLDQREQRLVELRKQIDLGAEQIAQGKVTDGEIVFEHLLSRLQPQSAE